MEQRLQVAEDTSKTSQMATAALGQRTVVSGPEVVRKVIQTGKLGMFSIPTNNLLIDYTSVFEGYTGSLFSYLNAQ